MEPAAASPPACERVTVLTLLIRQPQRAGQPQRRENPWNFGLSWTLLQTLSANMQSAFVQSYCFHSCCREIMLQTYKYYLFKWLLFFRVFLTSITKHICNIHVYQYFPLTPWHTSRANASTLTHFLHLLSRSLRHALRLYQQLQMRSVYTGRTDGWCFRANLQHQPCLYYSRLCLYAAKCVGFFSLFNWNLVMYNFVLFSQHKKCRNAPQLGRLALLHSCRRWRDASSSQVSCSKSFFFLSFF